MKFRFYILKCVVLLFIFFLVYECEARGDVIGLRFSQPEKINGGYRKCEVHVYKESWFWWNYDRMSSIKYYDDNGNLIERIDMRKEEIISQKYLYQYNSNNKVVSGSEIDGDGITILEFNCIYDNNDSLIEVNKIYDYYGYKNTVDKQLNKYNDNGELVQIIFLENDSIIHQENLIYENLDEENCKRIKTEYLDTNYVWISVCCYDDKNNLISVVDSISNGGIGRAIHHYDENNLLKETIHSYRNPRIDINNDDTIYAKIEYNYDSRGNRIEYRKYDGEGELNARWTKKFDEYGNVTEYISYYFGDLWFVTTKYVYKYFK